MLRKQWLLLAPHPNVLHAHEDACTTLARMPSLRFLSCLFCLRGIVIFYAAGRFCCLGIRQLEQSEKLLLFTFENNTIETSQKGPLSVLSLDDALRLHMLFPPA